LKKTDLKVEKSRRIKLKNYDRYLKTFRYGQALDAVLDSSKVSRFNDTTINKC